MGRLTQILNTELTPRRKKKRRGSSAWLQIDYLKLLMLLTGPVGIVYYLTAYRRVKLKRTLTVFLQIRMIVQNNAPLPEGLTMLALDAPSSFLASVLLSLSREMEQGVTLADAMKSYPSVFPKPIVAQVRMGEETGQLVKCMGDIVEQLRNQEGNSQSMRWQYMYIFIVLSAQVSIGSFLWVKVFPVFREILGEFGLEEPGWYAVFSFVGDGNTGVRTVGAVEKNASLPTAGLVEQSSGAPKPGVEESLGYNSGVVSDSSPTILIAVAIAIVLQIVILYWWNRSVRGIIQRGMYTLPILGRLMRLRQQLTIAQAMETLVHAGVPIHEVLKRVSTLGLGEPYRAAILRVADRLKSGQSLSDAWTPSGGLFTKEFVTVLSFGEYAGTLPKACTHLKESLSRSVRTRHAILVDAMIPMYVAVAGFVNLVILSTAYSMLIGLSEAMLFAL
ncbi:MAG: type II secretion system F family protein [Candidatus Hydrogenedentota bacterium]